MVFQPKTKDQLLSTIDTYRNHKTYAIIKYGIIDTWDVTLIGDMSKLFIKYSNFNENINNWDVSNVVNMQNMFCGCRQFNQSLNNWDVSNVVNMQNMFLDCYEFNQPLNNWNVSNVTNMSYMFFNCYQFSQSLNNWNVSNVVDITKMFYNCTYMQNYKFAKKRIITKTIQTNETMCCMICYEEKLKECYKLCDIKYDNDHYYCRQCLDSSEHLICCICKTNGELIKIDFLSH